MQITVVEETHFIIKVLIRKEQESGHDERNREEERREPVCVIRGAGVCEENRTEGKGMGFRKDVLCFWLQ